MLFIPYKVDEYFEHTYYQIPMELFENDLYKNKLSSDAKLLYGFLLNRLHLSAKNNWIAEERGIELTDIQKAVVKGEGGLIEGRIIKLVETIIAVQYKRVQRGVEKEAITDSASIMAELLSDDRIDAELVREIIGEQALEQLIGAEKRAVPQKEPAKAERKSDFEH